MMTFHSLRFLLLNSTAISKTNPFEVIQQHPLQHSYRQNSEVRFSKRRLAKRDKVYYNMTADMVQRIKMVARKVSKWEFLIEKPLRRL